MKAEEQKIIKQIGGALIGIVVILFSLVSVTIYEFNSKLLNPPSEEAEMLAFSTPVKLTGTSAAAPETNYFEKNFDISRLGESMEEQFIKYGFEIITHTPKHIGPASPDPDKRYAGNHLTCKSCHLGSGTKEFAAPYVGVSGLFPQYRGRENQIGSIEERVNGCMERSMNGIKMPADSKEMRAIVAYMSWLSEGVPAKTKIKGKGFAPITIPDRAVDLTHGLEIYSLKCASCHADDGTGQWTPDSTEYTYPPLWGPDSYNDGAGMHRVLTAAQFIKSNMPFGASAKYPQLTDEEAYDVAGYINSFERPHKPGTEKDFPDLKRKPVSCPYPPYADPYPLEQHKTGPFPEIIKYYQEKFNLKKTK